MASLPFSAKLTLFNNTAKETATSLNDVVMTIIDAGLHDYLSERQAPTDMPLVAFMPMSLRDESGGGGGNQVAADLIARGAACRRRSARPTR